MRNWGEWVWRCVRRLLEVLVLMVDVAFPCCWWTKVGGVWEVVLVCRGGVVLMFCYLIGDALHKVA